MRDSFVGPFTIIIFIGENAVEVRPTEELSMKHPVIPVSLVNPYHQTGEYKFCFRNKRHSTQDVVEVEDPPGTWKRSIHNIWSDLRTKKLIKINGWQKMPCQMVTFT
ncbi:hypothetical protein O181_011590 [Austropuccinia psidii MF-1]|uniref:Uncharacterized protein n=1 Tax=Austropuccinia psidii MF-1 TaxID=1389203 RepID=A0A9Q3BVF7_9BASI|nr:hypothetical protein [Austropuccinia psidii MF-1]